jgi:hypothetical protein
VHIGLLYECKSKKSLFANASRRLVTKQRLRDCLITNPQPYLLIVEVPIAKAASDLYHAEEKSERITLAESETLQNCVYFKLAIGCTYHIQHTNTRSGYVHSLPLLHLSIAFELP